MRFVLEVNLPDDQGDKHVADELSRILRYWAGGVRQMEQLRGVTQDVYDSAYTKVGTWQTS
jgi:hypothetical protein